MTDYRDFLESKTKRAQDVGFTPGALREGPLRDLRGLWAHQDIHAVRLGASRL